MVTGTPFQRGFLTQAFARLEKMLSPRMRQFLDRLPSAPAAKSGPRARGGESAPETLVARLLEATLHFRSARWLSLPFRAARKDYPVHPYRLLFAQGGVYLLAYVPEYRDVRTFAIDRIASVSLDKETFTPKRMWLEDVFANSLGVNTGPSPAGEIAFASRVAPYVRARVWHASQRLRDDADGGVTLSMDVCHDWALRSWILSWGPFAWVVTPPALRRRRSCGSAVGSGPGTRAACAASGARRPNLTPEPAVLRMRLFSPFAVVVAAVLLFLIGPTIVTFYTDWLWFGEVGYQPVFTTTLRAQGTLFVAAFLGAFVWLAYNIQVAVRVDSPRQADLTTREGVEIRLPGPRQLRALAPTVVMLVAVRSDSGPRRQWEHLALLALRGALRSGGSAPRPRRRLLRLLAPLPAVRPRPGCRRSWSWPHSPLAPSIC